MKEINIEDKININKLSYLYNLLYGEIVFGSVEKSKEFISELKISKETLYFINYLNEQINEKEFFVLKNFSESKYDLIALCHLLGREIFLSNRIGSYVYGFTTEPFSNDFSKNLKPGFFHTDFSAEKKTPNYIILQCEQVDPRFPYYGRNQFASVKKILNRLEELFPNITEKLLDMRLPYKFLDFADSEVSLLTKFGDSFQIRFHPGLVDYTKLNESHFVDGNCITEIIEAVALEVCNDICLDRGDLLVVSNKSMLHRRGECTVRFHHSIRKWDGRRINTIRFY